MVYIILIALILFDLYNVYKNKRSKNEFLKLTLAPLGELIILMGLYDLGYISYFTAVILFIPIAAYYLYITKKVSPTKKKK